MSNLAFFHPFLLTAHPSSPPPVQTISRQPTITFARRPIKAPVAPPPPPPTTVRTDSPLLTNTPTAPPPPPLWHYAWPRLLLLAVAAIWGTNFATVKLLQSGFHPVPLPIAAAARFTLSGLVLAPLAYYEQRKSRPSLDTYAAGLGVGLCVTGGYISQSISLVSTTASKSAFLCSLAVIAVPLLERLLHKINLAPPPNKEIPLITWGAPALAVVGVAMLELSGVAGPTVGDAYALLQAFFFAGGFIGNARAAARHPRHIVTLSALQLSTVGLFSLLWASVTACTDAGALVLPDLSAAFSTPSNTMAVLYAGIVTTALTVWLENIVLKRVSAAEMAVLLSTEPFWAAAFAAMVLGEQFGAQTIAGGALILAACLLNQLKNVKLDKLFKSRRKFITELCSVVTFMQVLLRDEGGPPIS